MHEYKATIDWKNVNGADFLKGRYTREHTWVFDGGLTVPASPSPQVVPTPWSNPANIDPEEAYVASLSSCHMLTFLWLAGKAGFLVESYRDEAAGVMAKNERGSSWVSKVTLHPQIVWSGEKQPTAEEIDKLHHRSHEECYIANSVKTEVVVAG
ncbi:organic hydroperoxide reductase OsmC/OhrA [Chthoniobacter flavus]|uniref:OsmC family protein n=1 Tax=Chthoniobacter flavus TaxID=191863 RepID=UPI0010506585|nr:OsmC family protein [Chthoniobacter flavus]TCO93504.1 organic hydroperoxide reductase OsmC/OhrA [Chthoniobacter flavus]